MNQLNSTVGLFHSTIDRRDTFAAIKALRDILMSAHAVLQYQILLLQDALCEQEEQVIEEIQQALDTFYEGAVLHEQVAPDARQIMDFYQTYWGQSNITPETALAGMAHAIRSPMIALNGNLDVLQQKYVDVDAVRVEIAVIRSVNATLMQVWVAVREYVDPYSGTATIRDSNSHIT